MLWINCFSLKHLWSTTSRKEKCWTHPCVQRWVRVPPHGNTDNTTFPLSLMPTVTAPASFARLELRLKITCLAFVPEKMQTHSRLSCFLSHFLLLSDIFKSWKCHSLVVFRWMDSPYRNHFTAGLWLLSMLPLNIYTLSCLIIELWRTSTSELLAA